MGVGGFHGPTGGHSPHIESKALLGAIVAYQLALEKNRSQSEKIFHLCAIITAAGRDDGDRKGSVG